MYVCVRKRTLNDCLSGRYKNEYDFKLKNKMSGKGDAHQKSKRNGIVSLCQHVFQGLPGQRTRRDPNANIIVYLLTFRFPHCIQGNYYPLGTLDMGKSGCTIHSCIDSPELFLLIWVPYSASVRVKLCALPQEGIFPEKGMFRLRLRRKFPFISFLQNIKNCMIRLSTNISVGRYQMTESNKGH